MEIRQLPSSSTTSSPSPPSALDDCLKLLKGNSDEQRLAGLLLATKFCNQNDHPSILKVYHAISPHFLTRLLHTGMGNCIVSGHETDNRDAYLHLSVTVLAAFCRVPEIAASSDMLSKVPLILQVMAKQSGSSILEVCYEFLLLIASSSDEGVTTLFESGCLALLAAQLPSLPDGSQMLELSIRLVHIIFSKISIEAVIDKNLSDLSIMVPAMARQFALLQNAVKFDLLQLLSLILSSDHSVPLHNALRAKSKDRWPAYVRAGVVDVLQNRVAPDQKLQGLIVAESMASILGERWLIDQMSIPDLCTASPSDRCLMLVLESARVEIAVLLNEIAYLKYEASSSKGEALPRKRHDLAIAYSLVEKIIKLISNISEEEGGVIAEATFSKIISGLNETIDVVLEYLKDAKDHGQRKGDDLVASVRVAGSYLAEAPLACKEKVIELLSYLLSVEGENESSPFLSICFMLPMLCQTTMKVEGVKVLASSGAYTAVVECLIRLLGEDSSLLEDNSGILLACDTVMNILLKREHIKNQLDESTFVPLLKALTYWTEGSSDTSIIMMASSICSLIFEASSEETLLRHPDFDINILHTLSQLVARSLSICGEDLSNDEKSDADLHQIIAEGYSRWADRFPMVRHAVEQGAGYQRE